MPEALGSMAKEAKISLWAKKKSVPCAEFQQDTCHAQFHSARSQGSHGRIRREMGYESPSSLSFSSNPKKKFCKGDFFFLSTWRIPIKCEIKNLEV